MYIFEACQDEEMEGRGGGGGGGEAKLSNELSAFRSRVFASTRL